MPSFLDVHAHGGKRALLRYGAYGVAAMLGSARRYRDVDWSTIRRVVFVCNGNICRSPFAETIARSRGLEAASAGIEATTGASAAPQAVSAASDFKVDLSAHRATHVGDFAFATDDLVLGFEPVHIDRLEAVLGRPPLCQVSLLAAWLRPPNLYIHDPYGSSADYFRLCFRRIDRAIELLRHRRGA